MNPGHGGKEVIRAGQYYGPGWTNNEAKSFAIQDATSMFVQACPGATVPKVSHRVFGDSQLMICFLTQVFKRP